MNQLGLVSAITNVGINSFSYRDRKRVGQKFDVPFMPQPFFFAPAWYTIFAGLTAFPFTQRADDTNASRWHIVANILGATSRGDGFGKPIVDVGISAGLLGSAIMYRRALEELPDENRLDHVVNYTSEMFAGWMSAAFLLTVTQSAERSFRKLKQSERPIIGAVAIGSLTAVGLAVPRTTGWVGFGSAVSWALTGSAFRKENPTWVRVAAGVGALAVATVTIQAFLDEQEDRQERERRLEIENALKADTTEDVVIVEIRETVFH